jgi:multidrug efflux pump subunit AcrA (membrane-fusion protein)
MPKPLHSRSDDAHALDGDSTLLPKDPPHWIAVASAWMVFGIFALALLAAVVIHIPETIEAPGVLIPEAGADPIQSPRNAVVREIRAAEGRQVAAGAVLFVLDSEESGDRDTQARTLDEELQARTRSMKQSEATDAADLAIKDHEIAQADEEVKFREKTVAVDRDLESRIEKLYKLGIYAQTDVVLRQLEVAGTEKDLSVAERARQELVLQRQQMRDEQARQRADRTSEIKALGIRRDALRNQLSDSERGLITIRAPYDAVVISLAANNPGSVVQNGQELCQLARADGKLRLRLVIAESGLARLAVGERLRFFAEAFPYQRYGTVAGTLTWVSPSAVSTPNSREFTALAVLDRDSIQVSGETRPLRVGMRGQARIAVGTRTLIEYALEPLRQLRENLGRPPP